MTEHDPLVCGIDEPGPNAACPGCRPAPSANGKPKRKHKRESRSETPEAPADTATPANENKRRPSAATMLAGMALANGVELFHTPDQTPFVSIQIDDHIETYSVNSTVFRQWLARLYYKQTANAANANALADAVNVLAAVALHDGKEIEVHTRIAKHSNAVYIDMADLNWRAIEIDSSGWRIVQSPPVRFRRTAGMYAITEPQRGGSVDLLRQFVNTKNESGFRLIVAWLLAALRPGRPFPVLLLRGEQGSAKSTLARLLRAIIDPNKAPLRRPPREERDLIIAASNGWIVGFDNLSHVPDWLSDSLCCLATGSGFGSRTLYTNDDETIFQATRPAILTAIEDVVTRGDLLDRCLSIELDPIPDDRRRTEAEIDIAFESARPLILGELLNAAAFALANISKTKLTSLPRMADFALWIAAAETKLGWPVGSFSAAFNGNRDHAHESILADSPICGPLQKLLDASGQMWTGTATELLERLATFADEKTVRAKRWPSRPNALTGAMKRLAPALRSTGITVSPEREAGTGRRILRIERAEKHRHTSSHPPAPNDLRGKSVTMPPPCDDPRDDCDDPRDDENALEMAECDDCDDDLRPIRGEYIAGLSFGGIDP